MASCFAGSEVASAWSDLEKKELEGLEIIDESEFKTVLRDRMNALADETITLCDLDPVEWNTVEQPKEEVLVNEQVG